MYIISDLAASVAPVPSWFVGRAVVVGRAHPLELLAGDLPAEGARDRQDARIDLCRSSAIVVVGCWGRGGSRSGASFSIMTGCALPSANGAVSAAEEPVERRAGAKGNASGQSTHRTQGRVGVSHALERVRTRARERKDERFTALLHHVDDELLRESFAAIQRKAAPGVDGVTWKDYAADLEANLTDLRDRIHRGAYRALPSRRVYIPKADGRQRPLAVAVLEDKIVQRAAATVFEAIYEEDFLGFSYGFRPGRGPHDALDALAVAIETRKVNYILDADIQAFLDPVSYCPLVDEAHGNSSA